MSLEDTILKAKRFGGGPWADRIYAELGYAAALSSANGRIYDELVEKAANTLIEEATKIGGVVSADAAKAAEAVLMPVSEKAKSYKVHCISHAHIDMNWMWGFQETASVTVDTFRTVLDLMKEFPKLTFAQSQASTYKIIEEYAPEMLEEIKERVHEGRWEVSASTWVETDKNMPNGESLSRHILYTKKYLSKLLDIPAESLKLDFEPDTFGHNISVPEICAKGGVKYYYHCRGNTDNEFIYRWRARSGAELLVWREPEWYNYDINPEMFRKVPQLCERYGISDFLSVYGVGDHGGGPTRRDVERLITIGSWPIMPNIVFSTYGAFFAELEKAREKFPVLEGELNFVFTGCYTTQTRIKMANRIAEARMYESEAINTLSGVLADGPRYTESYGKAWEQILFNHFHDILPGSGVVDTREYALGTFQRAMAAIQTNANLSMRKLAEAIDTSAFDCGVAHNTRSEGAAVGFNTEQAKNYKFPQTERGGGKKRIFHLFNSTQYDFDGIAEITVWDWMFDTARAEFADADGNVTQSKCLVNQAGYWGHYYKTFAVKVHVPALGYATYTLDEKSAPDYVAPVRCKYEQRDIYTDDDIVMENDKLRVTFDHATMEIISLFDKESGEDVAYDGGSFRLIHENRVHGMTSWRVGDKMLVENLNRTKDVVVSKTDLGAVRKSITYSLHFGERSNMSVTVSLDDGSKMLDYNVSVDFHEVGKAEHMPQLNFITPVSYGVSAYRYDVPFGTIDRMDINHDVPANSYAAAISENGEKAPAVMLVTDTKYGFRGTENSLAVTLIRASVDPDPYPEYGKHNIRIGVGIVDAPTTYNLNKEAAKFVHPIAVCSARAGKGTLPTSGQLVKVSGDVFVSAVKTAENGEGIIIRLSDISGKGGDVTLDFCKAVKEAYETDLNENVTDKLTADGNTVKASIEAYGIKTVLVKL